MRRFLSHLLVCIAFSLPVVGTAYADETDVLEQGRQLYISGRYEEAKAFLTQAIEGANPTLTDPQVVIKGRMLRAGSEWYLGNRSEAITQFEAVLKVNPNFEPDPIAFPRGMLDEFHRVRDRVQQDAQRNKSCESLQLILTKERTQCAQLSTRFKALQSFASEERVVTHHSRWIASLPFGVGQFQNAKFGLGLFFAISESATLLSAIISFTIHERLPASNDLRFDPERNRSVEFTSRVTNYVSFGAFIVLAVSGIIEAHLGYVPEVYETRKRILPLNLKGQRSPFRLEPIVSSMPGGGGFFGIRGTF